MDSLHAKTHTGLIMVLADGRCVSWGKHDLDFFHAKTYTRLINMLADGRCVS